MSEIFNPYDYTESERLTKIGRDKEHTVKDLIDAVNHYELYCTKEMLRFIIDNPDQINGCGRKGEEFPNTNYGLFIGWACFLHDAQWGVAKTITDLEIGNMNFRSNLDIIIEIESCCTFMKWMRGYRVRSYYNGVQYVGLPQEIKRRGFGND